MNKSRREQLRKATRLIEEAKEIISICAGEEESYYDDMPENLQGSEKGENAQEAYQSLENIEGELEEHISDIIEIIEQ